MSSVNKPQAMPVGDCTARAIRGAARAIQSAEALLITAGAGMSADSGLPVFRSNEGFWRAYEAQCQFVPLPVLRGLTCGGYTMRGQAVVSGSPTAVGVRGAALLQIKDSRGERVASVGFGRYAREGAYLWRLLQEGAKVPMQPMEYPREPWIARRIEPAAGRNAAMLGALAFVEYAIGVAWLRRISGGSATP